MAEVLQAAVLRYKKNTEGQENTLVNLEVLRKFYDGFSLQTHLSPKLKADMAVVLLVQK